MFPKSTEQQLADALDEIKILRCAIDVIAKSKLELSFTIDELKKEIEVLKADDKEKNKTITRLMLDKADYQKCRDREQAAFKKFMEDYRNLQTENENLKKEIKEKDGRIEWMIGSLRYH